MTTSRNIDWGWAVVLIAMRRHGGHKLRIARLGLLMLLALGGCAAPPARPGASAGTWRSPSASAAPAPSASPASDVQIDDAGMGGAAATTAESAAAAVSTMPAVTDLRLRQEILLHAALYRAAYESNVGEHIDHFLLESVQENDPPDLGTDPAEFKLRVLAELAPLGVPIAWMPSTWRTTQAPDIFPGTNHRATRLRIKITKRIEDQATVIGEVGDWTDDVGASRQGVTATWDGVAWNLERDRVRLVW